MDTSPESPTPEGENSPEPPDLLNGERFWRSSKGIGLRDMLAEARRVFEAQKDTYPRLLDKKRISRFDAEHRTACMAGIVELLEANHGK